MSSKEIREARTNNSPLMYYKIGIIMTPLENTNWCEKLRRITSTQLKSCLLRVAHGEPYYNEKLIRFGLKESAQCARCNEIETLEHKLFNCNYVKEIWESTISRTRKLKLSNAPVDSIYEYMGADRYSTKTTLTVHAEILQRILRLKDTDERMDSKLFVHIALKSLALKEKDENCKRGIESLLEFED